MAAIEFICFYRINQPCLEGLEKCFVFIAVEFARNFFKFALVRFHFQNLPFQILRAENVTFSCN